MFLVNVLCAFEENVYSVRVGWTVIDVNQVAFVDSVIYRQWLGFVELLGSLGL